MLAKEFAGLGSRLPVGVDRVVPLGFDHHKGVAADNRPRAVRIAFEGLADASCFPLRAWAVEAFGPRLRIVSAIPPLLDAPGHAHVKDLAHAGGVVAVVTKGFCPGLAVANLGSGARVAEHTGGVWVVARHKRRTRWTAVGPLAVGPCEAGASGSQSVDVGRLADVVAVAGECC